MKKGQFALLIALIVLCAGGIFGYVYFRLDKMENNKTEEKKEDEVKLLSKSELEQKMTEYANNNLNSIEKKYNLSKNIIINTDKDDYSSICLEYIKNGKSIIPMNNCFFNSTINLKDFQIKQNYKEIVDTINLKNPTKIYEIKGANNNYYLVIHFGLNAFIYDNSGNELDTIETSYGGSYYFISDKTHPLNKFDNTVSTDNIRIGNNYILTIDGNVVDGVNAVYVKKYTIDSNGKIKNEILTSYSWNEVTCEMCK